MNKIKIKEAYTVQKENEDDYEDYYHIKVYIKNKLFNFQPYKKGLPYIPLRLYIFMAILNTSIKEIKNTFGLVQTEEDFIAYCEKDNN